MTNDKDARASGSGSGSGEVPPKPIGEVGNENSPVEATLKARNESGKGIANDGDVFSALPIHYNKMPYTYSDGKDEHIGPGSGRLPYFDGQYFDHWKTKMLLHLDSMHQNVRNVTQNRFLWECKSKPTAQGLFNVRCNVTAASALVSALSPAEYEKIAGL